MSQLLATDTPNDITVHTDDSVVISEVSDPSTPVQIEREKAIQDRINIGQYPTPEAQSLEINEKAYEEGYDSDGQIGPFYDAVKGEGGIEFYEEAIFNPDPNDATADVPSEEPNSDIRVFNMQNGDIRKLLVKDLREQCKLLGLDARGNKSVLIERLNAAREKKHCYLPPDQLNNPERNQLANDGFSPLARWEMLKVDENAPALEDELEVNGIKYRSPTVPREEFERTGSGKGGQKKYNFSERFDRPVYTKEVRLPKFSNRGKLLRDKETNEILYENKVSDETVPNMEFIDKHGLDENSPRHM